MMKIDPHPFSLNMPDKDGALHFAEKTADAGDLDRLKAFAPTVTEGRSIVLVESDTKGGTEGESHGAPMTRGKAALTPARRFLRIPQLSRQLIAAFCASLALLPSLPPVANVLLTATSSGLTTAPSVTTITLTPAHPTPVTSASLGGINWASEPQLPENLAEIPHEDAARIIASKAAFAQSILSKTDAELAESGAINARELYQAKLLALHDIAKLLGITL